LSTRSTPSIRFTTFSASDFKVGRETYGLPITALREIVRVPEITAVPDASEYVEGVINLRGKIVSVLDLRKRLGEVTVAPSKRKRMLVVEHRGRLCGLIVDSASNVLKIPANDIDPSPTDFVEGGLNCVTGLGKYQGRLIVLLDIEKVLEFSGSRGKSVTPKSTGQSASSVNAKVAAASK